MNHWLVKTEPSTYSWADLQKEGRTAWTGVRNFQARNHLRGMKKGDSVLVYHSGDEKQVVALASVSGEAVPDRTAKEGDWVSVELTPVKPLPRPVPLAAVKKDKLLQETLLVRNSRLSVMPLDAGQFNRILELAQ